jgi:hypothetical protein
MTGPAPEADLTTEGFLRQDDASFAESLGLTQLFGTPDAAAAPPQPTTARPRDDGGRFTAAPSAIGEVTDPTPPETQFDEVTPPPPGEGEDEALPGQPVEAEAEAPKPITQFKVFDEGGELELPAIEIEFKGAKKVQKLPLDKVVRLAQSGAYNEELHQEVQEARRVVPQLQQTTEQLRAELAQLQQERQRFLLDDAYLLEQREQFERMNTPEERIRQLESRLAQYESGSAVEQELSTARSFVAQELAPTFSNLLAQYPDVTPEEVFGRFMLTTAPLQRGGKIAPEHYPKVASLLADDIGPWMAQLQEHRSTGRAQFQKDATAQVRQKQEELTQAKRALARRYKPTGAVPGSAAVSTKAPATAKDAVNDIIASVANLARG